MSGANLISIRHPYGGRFRIDFDAGWRDSAVAIFGPSGSGKTSILEMIAGVRRAHHARIRLNGRDLEDTAAGLRVPPEQRGIGWVPQDGSLFPHMSVLENVEFGARREVIRRPSRGEVNRKACSAAIELLEIAPLLDRRPRDLSGGERQRVALARALASGPAALLMDEPLASLDLPLRARIFPYLVRLRDETRVPIIYVTHDASEALGLARHVLVVENGSLVGSGAPEEILREPAALRLLDLVAIENRFSIARVDPDPGEGIVRVSTGGGIDIVAGFGMRSTAGGWVGIRAEDITIAIDRPTGLSAQNVIPGRVTSVSEEAGRRIITARCGEEDFRAAVTPHAMRDLGLEPGRAVWLVFKALAVQPLARGETAPPL
jgi:molybdate transport system ATP-binding protein